MGKIWGMRGKSRDLKPCFQMGLVPVDSGYKLGLFYLYVGWLSCNCLIVIMIVTVSPSLSLALLFQNWSPLITGWLLLVAGYCWLRTASGLWLVSIFSDYQTHGLPSQTDPVSSVAFLSLDQYIIQTYPFIALPSKPHSISNIFKSSKRMIKLCPEKSSHKCYIQHWRRLSQKALW